MDRPECNEEKGLDWRGSAPECRFNFAFLPSAWIKARARPSRRQIFPRDVAGKAAGNFIAHEDEQQTQPPAFYVLTLFPSVLLSLVLSLSPSRASFFLPYASHRFREDGTSALRSANEKFHSWLRRHKLFPAAPRFAGADCQSSRFLKVHRRGRNKVVTRLRVHVFSAARWDNDRYGSAQEYYSRIWMIYDLEYVRDYNTITYVGDLFQEEFV